MQTYAALNDFCDAIEALPNDLVRNFTLLREVDSKTVALQTQLIEEIRAFMDALPVENPVPRSSSDAAGGDQVAGDQVDDAADDSITATKLKSAERLVRIKELIMQGFAYSDEKVSVASAAADVVSRHMLRLDRDFSQLEESEIPLHLREGTPPPRITTVQAAIRNAPKRIDATPKKGAAVSGGNGTQGESSRGRSGGVHPAIGYRDDPGNASVGITTGHSTTTGSHHHHTTATNTSTTNNNNNGKSGEDKVTVSRTGRQSKPRRRSLSPLLPAKVAAQAEAAIANAGEDEPTYCYCEQVSYGEMVACDGDDCEREWFHLACVNLTSPPKGSWFCDACKKVAPPPKRRR